jgi:hypothetical protein
VINLTVEKTIDRGGYQDADMTRDVDKFRGRVDDDDEDGRGSRPINVSTWIKKTSQR